MGNKDSKFKEGEVCLDQANSYSQMKGVLEHGLFNICPKMKSVTQESLGFIYTPGVGEVCTRISKKPDLVDVLTTRKRNVIILTDGSSCKVNSRKMLPILDWLVVQIKYFSRLDAYPIAVPSHENLERTLEDLSNTYGCVLILEDVKPVDIPKDLIVVSQQNISNLLGTDIFDAEKTANVLDFLITKECYGWASEEAIRNGAAHQSLTLGVHRYYTDRIHDKDYKTNSMKLHEFYRGKIEIEASFYDIAKMKCLFTRENLLKILSEEDAPSKSKQLCIIVTDGTANLGLGNIGPRAGLPVMEGKCVLFKFLGNVDVMPICVNKRADVEEEIKAIKHYGANYAAVNMEDVSAPNCFKIETDLRKQLHKCVFHDDQHGTAIIIMAGLFNATQVVRKDLKKCRVVVNGAGAAGIAFVKLLQTYGVEDVIMCDTKGAIYEGRQNDMNPVKEEISKLTNKKKTQGTLKDCLTGADIFVGVSAGGALKPEWIKLMEKNPIVFALANPDPEILPD